MHPLLGHADEFRHLHQLARQLLAVERAEPAHVGQVHGVGVPGGLRWPGRQVLDPVAQNEVAPGAQELFQDLGELHVRAQAGLEGLPHHGDVVSRVRHQHDDLGLVLPFEGVAAREQAGDRRERLEAPPARPAVHLPDPLVHAKHRGGRLTGRHTPGLVPRVLVALDERCEQAPRAPDGVVADDEDVAGAGRPLLLHLQERALPAEERVLDALNIYIYI